MNGQSLEQWEFVGRCVWCGALGYRMNGEGRVRFVEPGEDCLCELEREGIEEEEEQ